MRLPLWTSYQQRRCCAQDDIKQLLGLPLQPAPDTQTRRPEQHDGAAAGAAEPLQQRSSSSGELDEVTCDLKQARQPHEAVESMAHSLLICFLTRAFDWWTVVAGQHAGRSEHKWQGR